MRSGEVKIKTGRIEIQPVESRYFEKPGTNLQRSFIRENDQVVKIK
jgi:hypothetical protein